MDWQSYPEHGDRSVVDVYDRVFYRTRLLKDSSRLFTTDGAELRLPFSSIGTM
jgi:hypothetical protein